MDIEDIQTHTQEQILTLIYKLENAKSQHESIEPSLDEWSDELKSDVKEFKISFRRCFIAREGWASINNFIEKTNIELKITESRLNQLVNASLTKSTHLYMRAEINIRYVHDLQKFISCYNTQKNNFNPVKSKNIKTGDLKLTMPIIALIHIYTNQPITKDNSVDIIKTYGKKSGLALRNMYDHYRYKSNITGVATSEVINRHNIERLELVANYFKDHNDIQNKVLLDLTSLKEAIKKENEKNNPL